VTNATFEFPTQVNVSQLTDAQLRRVIYSNWDFQQSLSALTFLLEECDFERKCSHVELRRFRCYEASAIVSFCRPFESSRASGTLGLRALGITLEDHERVLQGRLLTLRRKVVAHSDEDLMHYRGSLLQPFEELKLRIPVFTFSESLHLARADLQPLELMLRRLIHGISAALMLVAKEAPHRIEHYKQPSSQHA
jgi:hypothetical protein